MARGHATQEHELPGTGRAARAREPGLDGRPVVDRAPTAPWQVSVPAIAQLQRLAGNAAAGLLIQRLCIEDEAGSGATARGPGGVELPPPIEEGVAGPGAEGGPTGGATTAPTGAPPAHRTLRLGPRGEAVTDLQNRLNAAGAADPALEPDGVFGRLTKAAVREYQSTHDLEPDGVVGPLTWASLDAGGGGGGGGGGVEPPVPVTDPLAGIVTIVGHDSSAGAIARAREQAIELYGSIAPANRTRMEADPIWIDVIPHNKKLTELPEYAHLAGTTTFDGRIWDDVRGIQTEVNGLRRVAVAEEDLVTVAGTAASYGAGFLEAHEGGHGLQFSGLTTTQQATLVTIYAARLAASGPITQTTPAGAATAMWLNPSWYSAANKEEYFANSVAAYHGHPYTNGTADVAMYTRSWLQTNDAPMHQLLEAVYQQGATP
jgi:peptidoglycan hydrolase-like protein with peptidoglycan-binding domain